jgi:hypothetical protein
MDEPHNNDRRKKRRYRPSDVAFALIHSDAEEELAQITDISLDGVGVYYLVGRPKSKNCNKLDIMLANSDAEIISLPCQTVCDIAMPNDNPSDLIRKRKRCIQFKPLTRGQAARLQKFIHLYTDYRPR